MVLILAGVREALFLELNVWIPTRALQGNSHTTIAGVIVHQVVQWPLIDWKFITIRVLE